MTFSDIGLASLVVNRANDRHGELENETAAIAWLFNNREQHMRALARDIVERGEIYEAPLVFLDRREYVVFDGNRRVTCLKILDNPRRAPTVELQSLFADLRSRWSGAFPTSILCQVEDDRDRIDDILFRRHTGAQGGVGQTTWDDRMKENFVLRTGRGGGVNVADEVEKHLIAAGMLPAKKVPRSNLNRLLSGEGIRNRLGLSVRAGKLEFTHREEAVLPALQRVAEDMANRRVVLGHIWDVAGKNSYLDGLASEGLLPKPADKTSGQPPTTKSVSTATRPAVAPKPSRRTTLIPRTVYEVTWGGHLQRHKSIWDELQFHLNLDEHPNANAVLMRVLFDLSVDNYIQRTGLRSVRDGESANRRARLVAKDLHDKGLISQNYLTEIEKLSQAESIVSTHTLNRYVHSPNFAPSPAHLTALWDTLSELIVLCLNA